MVKIRIEQRGGLAGIGDSGSALARILETDSSALIPGHRRLIDQLFERASAKPEVGGDQITFKISRESADERETIIVGETDLPQALQAQLKLGFK